MELAHDILLWIHIPAGTLSLFLFWIPVATKKGENLHRKSGVWYYYTMWVVVATAFLLCGTNTFLGNYVSAIFLGYLSILTAHPLWYSYAILQEKKEWSPSYFKNRRLFCWVMFASALCMIAGAIYFQFRNQGILMAFFGVLGLPAGKEALRSLEVAQAKEGRIERHIVGIVGSGIAAYTAFFAFGGRALFAKILIGELQVIPWILPTFIGIGLMKYYKKKYT